MRIVYFIDHLRADGTQRVLEQLVTSLAHRGHRQTVICLNDSWDSELVRRLHDAGVEVCVLGRWALVSGYGLLALWYMLKRRHYDVAVTLLFYSDVVGRAVSRSAGVPRIVSSIRARNTNYAAWQRALVRSTMRLADAVIINSESVRSFVIAEEGAPKENTIFIPNGVEFAAYCNPLTRSELRRQLQLPPERVLIGSVGRLTHQKGFDILLDAFAKLECSDIDLLLVGRGEEEARLRARAARLGIQKRVHFAGYRQDVPRLLAALDVYVQPSRFEGMPNALLEAMAAGCSIVASAVDGSRELIEDGVHGWLVPPENVGALASAMHTALHDPRAVQLGAAAQRRAREQFSVGAMIDAWETVMLGQSGLPRQQV